MITDYLLRMMVTVLYIIALVQRPTTTLTLTIPLSTYRTIVSNNVDDFFKTVSICKLVDCAKLCFSVVSCVLGNYRVRGHVCYLTHNSSEVNYLTAESRVPGFVSWTKDMLNMVLSNDGSLCQGCRPTQRCIVDKNKATCELYGCGRPSCPTSSIMNGNLYTVGSILRCVSYKNDVNDVITTSSATCMTDGIWKSGYTEYRLGEGQSYALRIVDTAVNQSSAIEKCKEDRANLTTVFTIEKIELFRQLFASKSGDYWVDAKRVEGSFWVTSYGQTQSMGYDIWVEYTLSYPDDNCTRMRRSRQYKLDDYSCKAKFNYVCEIQL